MKPEEEKFYKDLARKGQGRAPNGADYKITSIAHPPIPCVERTYKGNRETFGLGAFGDNLEAIRWAEGDGMLSFETGRHVYYEES